MEEFKPGQVISPQAPDSPIQPTAGPDSTPGPTQPIPPQSAAAPPASQATVTGLAPEAATSAQAPATNQPAAGWQFRPETPTATTSTAGAFEPLESSTDKPLPAEITWTASEFIAHEKSPAWYARLALAGIILAAVIYFITKDKITTGIVLLCAIALGVFAARKPNVQTYVLNEYGLKIGQRVYPFQGYKSFAIAEDGAIASVVFMPLKRFMPALTVYLDPEMEEQVVDYLAQLLPFEEHHQDVVDSLMNRIRF